MMLKRSLSCLVAGAATAVAILAPISVGAADLGVMHARQVTRWCDPCGRLRVSYDYHREMRMTYGTGFDPRNFDTTEPYYYFGRVRAYPQFWVEADPVQ
jgi:hypothetical protein